MRLLARNGTGRRTSRGEFTGESDDNSGALGANRWRHVAFIEQRRPVGVEDAMPESLVQEAALQGLASEVGLAAG